MATLSAMTSTGVSRALTKIESGIGTLPSARYSASCVPDSGMATLSAMTSTGVSRASTKIAQR
ncbi:hypothetical protein B0H17DRAFT_400100 [Mycena rosella]|uniref:Uncharacterized protein n=1 Tax=Mycena rosella TaxID=1033263 RepID=A0AAD7DQ06_MYCRO|nr:hypothetical protein B0H17DRAFT_400100 [Mycena rosella]